MYSRWAWSACGAAVLVLAAAVPSMAQQGRTVELTLESAVLLGMDQSFRVRQLRMGIERTRAWQRAQRASLKTRIDLDVEAPEYEVISDYQYDSGVGRDVLVRENSRRWQANLSVRQPVILFGYPTDGYLSLNSRLYRYTQLQDDDAFTRYYNRYFVAYEQPLFQPNELRHDLQDAEYDTEEAEMDYRENVVRLIDDMAEDYYDLLELVEERSILENHVAMLEEAEETATSLAARDSAFEGEAVQIRIELANARERVEQVLNEFRLASSRMKTRLRLDPSDSLFIRPVPLEIDPVEVDVERAVRFGLDLTPRMRELEIRQWNDEWSVEQTRARGGFRLDLRLTYGREMANEVLGRIWQEPRNSYTVSVNADIPIWDWGARSARVEAAEIGLRQTELRMEEAETEIRSNIVNAVQNLEAYRERATVMEENLSLATELARSDLERYAVGEITTLELLRSLDRRTETATNFLDTFLGYRNALLDLQQRTYYDFERDVPVLRRFDITTADPDLQPQDIP